MDHDFENDPIGVGSDGRPVFLKDIWPTTSEIDSVITSSISSDMFKKDYASVFDGDKGGNLSIRQQVIPLNGIVLQHMLESRLTLMLCHGIQNQ